MSAEPREMPRQLVRVRSMTLQDVPRIIEIEQDAYAYPWSEGIFRDCVRVGYVCRVVEFKGAIYGYAIMSFAADEAHLLNICIHHDLREQGVGRRLLQYLHELAWKAGMRVMFLEVRPSNPVAIHLYESFGFTRVGVRKGYYQGSPTREDAWVYRLDKEPEASHGIDARV